MRVPVRLGGLDRVHFDILRLAFLVRHRVVIVVRVLVATFPLLRRRLVREWHVELSVESQLNCVFESLFELAGDEAMQVQGAIELHGAAEIVLPRQDSLPTRFTIFELSRERLSRRAQFTLALQFVVDESSDQLAPVRVDHAAFDKRILTEVTIKHRPILKKLQTFALSTIRVTFGYIPLIPGNGFGRGLFAVRR